MRIRDNSAKDLLFNAIYTILRYLLSMVSIMYVARVLHPEYLGTAQFVSSAVGYFAMFASLGIPVYAFKTCAFERDDKPKLRKTVRELVILGIVISAAVYIIMTAAVLIVPKFYNDKSIFFIFGMGMFFTALQCEWFFTGLEDWAYLAISSTLIRMAGFVAIILLVKDESDLLIYAALTLFVPAVTVLVNFLRLKHFFKGTIISGRIKPFRHIKTCLSFFLMSCVVNIYNQMDILMLGFIKDNSTVGFYSISAKVKTILTAPGGVVRNVFLPKAVRYYKDKDLAAFEKITLKGMSTALFFEMPLFFFGIVCSSEIIVFLSGPEYIPATRPLILLLISIPFIAISNIIGGQVLVPAGLEKKLLKTETVGMVLNLIANLVLIPFFSMDGAAVATSITEIAVTAIVIFYVAKYLKIRLFDYRTIFLITIDSAISGIVAYLVKLVIISFNSNVLIILIAAGLSFAFTYLGLYYIWTCIKKNSTTN